MLSRRVMMSAVAAALVGTVFVTTAAAASAETLRARVTFRPKPADLTFQSTAEGTARFHTLFASLSSLSVTFSFGRDLLEPAEEIEFHVEGWGGAFSIRNVSSEPQREVTLLLDKNNAEVLTLFLDGQNSFTVLMLTGTVRLTRVEIVAVGVPAT